MEGGCWGEGGNEFTQPDYVESRKLYELLLKECERGEEVAVLPLTMEMLLGQFTKTYWEWVEAAG